MSTSLSLSRNFFKLVTIDELLPKTYKPKKKTVRCSLHDDRPDNRSRTVWQITELSDCNYDSFHGFLTLTFAQNVTDPKYASHCLDVFFKRLRRYFGTNISYLGILEYQKDFDSRTGIRKPNGGSIHYHFLVDFKRIPFTTLHSLWSFGRVHFSPIYHRGEALVHYLAKYIRKSSQCPFGFRRIFVSRDLVRPLRLVDNSASSLAESLFPLSTCLFAFEFSVPNSANIGQVSIYRLDYDFNSHFPLIRLYIDSFKDYNLIRSVIAPPSSLKNKELKQLSLCLSCHKTRLS